MYNKSKFQKKPKSIRGYIKDYKVDPNMIKNDYVGQKDYFHHEVTIEGTDGTEETFLLRQLSDEKKFEKGDFVTFRYNASPEAKSKGFKHLIEAKSFAKTMSPEELAAYNQHMQASNVTSPEKTVENKEKQSNRRGFRR